MLSVEEYYQHDNENKQTSHGGGEAFQPSDVVLGRDYKRCFLALECDLRKPLRANGPISRESLPYPYIAYTQLEAIDTILASAPNRDVRVIVVTDGQRVDGVGWAAQFLRIFGGRQLSRATHRSRMSSRSRRSMLPAR